MFVKIVLIISFFITFVKAGQNKDIEEVTLDVIGKLNKENEIKKILVIAKTSEREGEFIYGYDLELLKGDGTQEKVPVCLSTYVPEIQELHDMLKDQQKLTWEITSKLKILQNKVGDHSEKFWVDTLGIKGTIYVKEDVEKSGNFVKFKHGTTLDLEHSELVITTLAKFHAMTAVLLENGDLSTNSIPNRTKIDKWPINVQLNDVLITSMQIAWGPEWAEAADRLKIKLESLPDAIAHINSQNFPLKVLNIQDLLIHSLFFQYSISDTHTSKSPLALKIDNDFYSLVIGYPVLDVQIFLGSLPNNTVKGNFNDHLIKQYHNTLTRYLKQFHYKGEIPTFDSFNEEIKKTNLFKLYLSMVLSRFVILTDADVRVPIDDTYLQEVEKQNKKFNREELIFFKEKVIQYLKPIVQNAINDDLI